MVKNKKECVKGFECGSSCISRTKSCDSNLGDTGKVVISSFLRYAKRIGNTDVRDLLKGKIKPQEDSKNVVPSKPKSIPKNFQNVSDRPRDSVNGEIGRNVFENNLTRNEGNYYASYTVGKNDIKAFADSFPLKGVKLKLVEKELKELGIDTSKPLQYVDVNFTINNSFSSEGSMISKPSGITRGETIKKISTATKLATSEVLSKIPNGTVIVNRAEFTDGKGNSREKLYQRAGFGKPDKNSDREMRAVKIDGKLVPLNPPSNRIATKKLPIEPLDPNSSGKLNINKIKGTNKSKFDKYTRMSLMIKALNNRFNYMNEGIESGEVSNEKMNEELKSYNDVRNFITGDLNKEKLSPDSLEIIDDMVDYLS